MEGNLSLITHSKVHLLVLTHNSWLSKMSKLEKLTGGLPATYFQFFYKSQIIPRNKSLVLKSKFTLDECFNVIFPLICPCLIKGSQCKFSNASGFVMTDGGEAAFPTFCVPHNTCRHNHCEHQS